MVSIKSSRIDNYTVGLKIEDREISIMDKVAWKRNKIKRNRRLRNLYRAGSIFKVISVTLGIITFLYMIGIAGHADFCIDMGIEDTWDMMQYILRGLFSLIMMLLSVVTYHVGSCLHKIRRSI